jgi:hypothetical protein
VTCRPLTDTERDMVSAAIVEHNKLCKAAPTRQTSSEPAALVLSLRRLVLL